MLVSNLVFWVVNLIICVEFVFGIYGCKLCVMSFLVIIVVRLILINIGVKIWYEFNDRFIIYL